MKAILILLAALCAPGLRAASSLPDGLYAEISTPRGTMVLRLEPDRAPLPTANFVGLAEGQLGPSPRKPFYNGVTFHRVVPGFVIQGGDPLGTGEGDPGYSFEDDFNPAFSHDHAGVLSMANAGPDTNGCQFFITLAPVERLDFLHSIFGEVIEGRDLPQKIEKGDTMEVHILRIGAKAQAYHVNEASFAALRKQVPAYAGDLEPGPKAQFWDPEGLLPAEPPRALGFTRKLNNFRRVTGQRITVRLFTHAPSGPGALAQNQPAPGELIILRDAASNSWVFQVSPELLAHAAFLSDTARPALLAAIQARFEAYRKAQSAQLKEPADLEKLQVDALLAVLLPKFLGP